MRFYNLHLHSEYSTADSLISINSLIEKAKEYKHDAVCITDHGSLSGYAELWKECKKNGIKPIIGNEMYYIEDLDDWERKKKEAEGAGKNKKEILKRLRKNYHIILIAKNQEGIENLFKLHYESYKNFYYKPRVDKKILKKYSGGLIATTACLAGSIQQSLLSNFKEKALIEAEEFKSIYNDDFYIEVQFNEMPEQVAVNKYLIKISKKIGTKVVIGVDSHYLEKKDARTHQTLLLTQGKKTYRDLEEGNDGVWEFTTKNLFFKNYDCLKQSWKEFDPDFPERFFIEGVKSTSEIVDKVGEYNFDTSPKLKDIAPDIKDKNIFLKKYCVKELKKRGLFVDLYKKRLKRELEVITNKDFVSYFIFVKKILEQARKTMLVGVGRGSAAGSLVCYLLNITGIDPVKYGLFFERFLDESRGDYPDIDCDVEDNDFLKNWMMEYFGEDCAAISNYSTYKISMLLKDVCRIYNIKDPNFSNIITKGIRKDFLEAKGDDGEDADIDDYDINDLYKNSDTLRSFLKDYPFVENDLKVLLGKIRHVGKHAAGMIVCDNLITNQPIMIKDGIRQAVLEEGTHSHISADMGFIKVDILGLNTLKIIHETCKFISKDTGKNVKEILKNISPENIDFYDKNVYDHVYKKHNLVGVFQFDTNSARQLVEKVKPENIEELCAINALNRPATMRSGTAFDYADLKKGKQKKNYFGNEKIKEILKDTYSVLVYQEQQMRILNEIGGVDLVKTDRVRKWFSKKMTDKPEIKKELMDIKKTFIDGAIKKGIGKNDSELIWERMEYFSKYSFNRAHSFCYAVIAYQCSFLKTYYPVQFYTSLLNCSPMEKETKGQKYNFYEQIINEAKKNGIKIHPLSLNNSELNFSYNGNEIFWGLSKIKGIGEKQALAILNSGFKKNPIKSYTDFLTRDLDWRLINKTVVERLIYLGVFNYNKKYGEKYLLEFYLQFKKYKKKIDKNGFKKEYFKEIKIKTKEELEKNKILYYNLSEAEKAEKEFEAYRMNIVYSPFVVCDRERKLKKLLKEKKISSLAGNKKWRYGAVKKISEVKDKRGKLMAFFDVYDHSGNELNCLIFSSNYEKNKIVKSGLYLLNGTKDGTKFIVEQIIDVDNLEL